MTLIMENIFTKVRKQLPESAGCALLMSVAFLSICVCAVCLCHVKTMLLEIFWK